MRTDPLQIPAYCRIPDGRSQSRWYDSAYSEVREDDLRTGGASDHQSSVEICTSMAITMNGYDFKSFAC